MIIGIGVDMTDIRRIERALERHGEAFARRIFTPVEREASETRHCRASSYARRFAAKEACAKAMGAGVPARGVHWRHIGVVNDSYGAPSIALSDGALLRLEEITPLHRRAIIHISITDEYPYALAKAVIEAIGHETG